MGAQDRCILVFGPGIVLDTGIDLIAPSQPAVLVVEGSMLYAGGFLFEQERPALRPSWWKSS